MKYSILFVIAIFFFACDEKEPTTQTEKPIVENTETKNETPPTKTVEPPSEGGGESVVPSGEQEKEMQRKNMYEKKLTDGTVSFDIICRNGEQSKFQILGTGFEKTNVKFNGAVEGQLMDSHLLDLNKDGFCEIYLVFSQTDDSGNIMLKGYSSYRNKSAGEIYVKDTDMMRAMNTDKVFVEDKKLKRSFKDENGNEVSFEYKLEKGESSFVLTPNKI